MQQMLQTSPSGDLLSGLISGLGHSSFDVWSYSYTNLYKVRPKLRAFSMSSDAFSAWPFLDRLSYSLA